MRQVVSDCCAAQGCKDSCNRAVLFLGTVSFSFKVATENRSFFLILKWFTNECPFYKGSCTLQENVSLEFTVMKFDLQRIPNHVQQSRKKHFCLLNIG